MQGEQAKNEGSWVPLCLRRPGNLHFPLLQVILCNGITVLGAGGGGGEVINIKTKLRSANLPGSWNHAQRVWSLRLSPGAHVLFSFCPFTLCPFLMIFRPLVHPRPELQPPPYHSFFFFCLARISATHSKPRPLRCFPSVPSESCT